MPISNKALVTFTSGEWTPRLDVRQDLEKANNAARTVRNMIVSRSGGVFRRPGLRFIAAVKVIP